MKYICIFIRLIILASLPLWVLAQESNTLELFQALQSFSKESSLLILNELENPFAPIASTQESEPLRLYAIINKKALINDQWYMLNDTIRGYKITAIYPQFIQLQKAQNTLDLFINEKLP
ncbi:hypothetical protein LS68_009050 [Helicobacter sp. MIT 05-5293]|uniref:Uncharacterized protein n=1 Tax=uncultured Helicobacter sp. TaxID=175537 RepID=A0A650EKM0_9HELI|nr:hypothetical protein [Helicobacter sp. MIT 05-5293]QGT50307.1 hypothetical protein Helico6505_1390 [uncultured Helicobacter sp.]TLD79976.1 hypothetical protein LS68_009050 [Helicobacter sp. MIT 05-5293]